MGMGPGSGAPSAQGGLHPSADTGAAGGDTETLLAPDGGGAAAGDTAAAAGGEHGRGELGEEESSRVQGFDTPPPRKRDSP